MINLVRFCLTIAVQFLWVVFVLSSCGQLAQKESTLPVPNAINSQAVNTAQAVSMSGQVKLSGIDLSRFSISPPPVI